MFDAGDCGAEEGSESGSGKREEGREGKGGSYNLSV
jgi:hypothetical protein